MKQTLYVYDLDDTLIKSETVIYMQHKKTGKKLSIYTYEWADLNNKTDYYYDFSDFGNFDKLKKAKIIKKTYKDILDKISKGYNVALMTSRGEYEVVKKYIKYIGLNIPDHLIFTVGRPMKGYHGEAPERKKQGFLKLMSMGYNDFYFYDDSLENIVEVKTLETEYDITINAIQIK